MRTYQLKWEPKSDATLWSVMFCFVLVAHRACFATSPGVMHVCQNAEI
jgi:hypothetical protein